MSDETTPAKRKKKSTEKAERVFTPAPGAKSKATTKRVIAIVLWVIAIGIELGAIFWLLRPPFDELVENGGFPQWRWYSLLGVLVVIGILSVIGSMLWKQANRLDPASEKEPFRFFIQNQLGAIIALVAFLPLIILIFTNKDMNAKQKNTAGIVGIVIAVAAILLGVDFKPMSQEQAAVESQVVAELTGQDVVYWTEGGAVMHLCEGVSDLSNSANILESTTGEALDEGKEGITLKIEQELEQCGLPVPENVDDIVDWVRESRGLDGGTDDAVVDEEELEEVPAG